MNRFDMEPKPSVVGRWVKWNEADAAVEQALEALAVTKGNMERMERGLYLIIGKQELELESLGIENDRRGADIEQLNELLRRIGDLAHDHSTGPAVPDILWEIRDMAYQGFIGGDK